MSPLRSQRGPGQPPLGTLLLVDDQEQNLGLLSEVLQFTGYSILTATEGAAALALAQQLAPQGQPDAMLLDLMMPGMDGFEVLRRLRADPATQHLPVLVITAMALDAQQRDFLARNAQDVFQKGGGDTEDLLARITLMLARAREGRGESGGADSARGANS